MTIQRIQLGVILQKWIRISYVIQAMFEQHCMLTSEGAWLPRAIQHLKTSALRLSFSAGWCGCNEHSCITLTYNPLLLFRRENRKACVSRDKDDVASGRSRDSNLSNTEPMEKLSLYLFHNFLSWTIPFSQSSISCGYSASLIINNVSNTYSDVSSCKQSAKTEAALNRFEETGSFRTTRSGSSSCLESEVSVLEPVARWLAVRFLGSMTTHVQWLWCAIFGIIARRLSGREQDKMLIVLSEEHKQHLSFLATVDVAG